MTTEFPYLSLTKGSPYRPYVLVGIQFKRGLEKTMALLDSGADFTFIPLHIVQRVGLSLKPKNMLDVSGVGGGLRAYRTKATLIFYLKDEPEIILKNVQVLVPNMADFPYTLLGRDTIFNEFIITFDEYDKKVIFKRKYH